MRAPPPESSTSLDRFGEESAIRIGDAARRERVAVATISAVVAPGFGCAAPRDQPLDIGGVEQLASGGLGRRRREVRRGEQLVDDGIDRRCRRAASRPSTSYGSDGSTRRATASITATPGPVSKARTPLERRRQAGRR